MNKSETDDEMLKSKQGRFSREGKPFKAYEGESEHLLKTKNIGYQASMGKNTSNQKKTLVIHVQVVLESSITKLLLYQCASVDKVFCPMKINFQLCDQLSNIFFEMKHALLV